MLTLLTLEKIAKLELQALYMIQATSFKKRTKPVCDYATKLWVEISKTVKNQRHFDLAFDTSCFGFSIEICNESFAIDLPIR